MDGGPAYFQVYLAMFILTLLLEFNDVFLNYIKFSILLESLETCDDGIQNQDEEMTDCGGSCPACPGSCYT